MVQRFMKIVIYDSTELKTNIVLFCIIVSETEVSDLPNNIFMAVLGHEINCHL